MLRQQPKKLFSVNSQKKLPSFLHFDLGLTEDQRKALNQLKIEKPSANYENNGDLTNLLTEINEFIASLALDGNAMEVSLPIANYIVELIESVLFTMGQESAWVVIRASQPNPLFATPRWHIDGHYFAPYEGEQHKVVATLVGPSTLFQRLPSEKREAFYALANNRSQVAAYLSTNEPESPALGQGTVFVAGARESAAVHSEPNITHHRLFVAVTPGTKAQVKERHELQLAFEKSPEFREIINGLRRDALKL